MQTTPALPFMNLPACLARALSKAASDDPKRADTLGGAFARWEPSRHPGYRHCVAWYATDGYWLLRAELAPSGELPAGLDEGDTIGWATRAALRKCAAVARASKASEAPVELVELPEAGPPAATPGARDILATARGNEAHAGPDADPLTCQGWGVHTLLRVLGSLAELTPSPERGMEHGSIVQFRRATDPMEPVHVQPDPGAFGPHTTLADERVLHFDAAVMPCNLYRWLRGATGARAAAR